MNRLHERVGNASSVIAPSGEVGDAAASVVYTCPMHPLLRQSHPGRCPICGMSLELLVPKVEAETVDPELKVMTCRLWLAPALTLPLLAMAMAMNGLLPFDLGAPIGATLSLVGWAPPASRALEAVLATLVVFWAGGPFFVLGWRSLVSWQLNMFSLVVLGVSTAYGFSLFSLVWPEGLPQTFVQGEGPPLYFEAAAVIVTLVLVGQVLELRARARTSGAIKALLRLAPQTAVRVDAKGHDETVTLDAVAAGDRLRVKPGAQVPVDGVVLEGSSTIDESMINGEPMPSSKSAGSPVVGATLNQAGSFTMRAEHVGAETLLARIVALVAEAGRTRAPIQKLVDRIARWFVLFNAVLGRLGSHRGLSVCARAGHAGVHHGRHRARLQGWCTHQGCRGAGADGTGRHAGRRQDRDVDRRPTHGPVGGRRQRIRRRASRHVGRLPGDAQRTSTGDCDRRAGPGGSSDPGRRDGIQRDRRARREGYSRRTGSRLGNAQLLADAQVDVRSVEGAVDALRTQGQTVMFLSAGTRLVGYVGVADAIKATAPAAIRRLKASGLRIVMLTGDNAVTAAAVGRLLDLDDVKAGVMPEDKYRHVKALQEQGHLVAMAGDGINDAPALAQADVGIAMGTGTDIAIGSARVVLVGGDLGGLVKARALSQAMMRNIRENLFFAFVYNVVGISVAAGALYPWLGIVLSPMVASAAMAVSSISVIGNALRLRHAKVGDIA